MSDAHQTSIDARDVIALAAPLKPPGSHMGDWVLLNLRAAGFNVVEAEDGKR